MQITLQELTRSNVPHACVTSVLISRRFALWPRLYFRVTSHFETSARDDSKRTLNNTRSNIPLACVSSFPESQISLFCSTPSRFRDTRLPKIANSPNGVRLTLNMSRSKYCVYHVLPPRPKFWSFSLYDQASVSWTFKDVFIVASRLIRRPYVLWNRVPGLSRFIIPHWLWS